MKQVPKVEAWKVPRQLDEPSTDGVKNTIIKFLISLVGLLQL